jgi:serine/threonine-protein kinase RsbW
VAVPPGVSFLYVLRAVVGSVGGILDAPVDVIDDLRLAVDEAASLLLARGPGDASELVLEVEPGDGVIAVVVRLDTAKWSHPDPSGEETLPWVILRALTTSAAFSRSDEEVAISFTKRFDSGT